MLPPVVFTSLAFALACLVAGVVEGSAFLMSWILSAPLSPSP